MNCGVLSFQSGDSIYSYFDGKYGFSATKIDKNYWKSLDQDGETLQIILDCENATLEYWNKGRVKKICTVFIPKLEKGDILYPCVVFHIDYFNGSCQECWLIDYGEITKS